MLGEAFAPVHAGFGQRWIWFTLDLGFMQSPVFRGLAGEQRDGQLTNIREA